MAKTTEKATEEIILDAAVAVFTRKGFAAARTEEIAREAGINRALLHYYYRDKQTMFDLIFEKRFSEFFKGLFVIFDADNISLFEKIRRMIDHEITTLLKHPDLPRFVITEVAHQPERLFIYGQKMGLNPRIMIAGFEDLVKKEVEAGTIKPVNGRTLLINIMSLCIYPFVASPVIRTMMQLNDSDFVQLMENRKQEIYELIVNSLKK